jgi:hypothetical protein
MLLTYKMRCDFVNCRTLLELMSKINAILYVNTSRDYDIADCHVGMYPYIILTSRHDPGFKCFT